MSDVSGNPVLAVGFQSEISPLLNLNNPWGCPWPSWPDLRITVPPNSSHHRDEGSWALPAWIHRKLPLRTVLYLPLVINGTA